MSSFFDLLAVCTTMMLVQVLAALPWLLTLRASSRPVEAGTEPVGQTGFSRWIGVGIAVLVGVLIVVLRLGRAGSRVGFDMSFLWFTLPIVLLLVGAAIGVQFLRRRGSPGLGFWVPLALVTVVGGLALAGGLLFDVEPTRLQLYGRWFAAILHLQLAVDFLILLFAGLLLVWPKGGAVALAAFREGIRQPMFWVIGLAATLFLFVSMVFPYFTFGDDFKFYKQIGFDVVMLGAMLFGVLAASLSVHEEIEGRTAITLLSKPVTRRHFLLGKFVGILAAAGALTLMLGWMFTWSLHVKPRFDSKLDDINDEKAADILKEFRLDDVNDPLPEQLRGPLRKLALRSSGEPVGKAFLTGNAGWWGDTTATHLGLLLGFGQVTVLLSVAVALGTRIPFVANLLVCLVVFLLGHLSPVLAQATAPEQLGTATGAVPGQGGQAVQLVHFVARVFEALFPSLNYFNNSTAVIRETPLDAGAFAVYVGSVLVYALGYAVVALLIGLILFEDRDLA